MMVKRFNPYTISNEGLVSILFEISVMRKDVVLELGSGQSTIAIAQQLRSIGRGSIISFEQDKVFASQLNEILKNQDLLDLATVVYNPIGADGWYSDLKAIASKKFKLLIVDGPSANKPDISRSRRPALDKLEQFLTDDAVIFVDDTDRRPEHEMARSWVANRENWQLHSSNPSFCFLRRFTDVETA